MLRYWHGGAVLRTCTGRHPKRALQATCPNSVAFCSPAKSLTFQWFNGKPSSWHKVKVLTSKPNAPKSSRRYHPGDTQGVFVGGTYSGGTQLFHLKPGTPGDGLAKKMITSGPGWFWDTPPSHPPDSWSSSTSTSRSGSTASAGSTGGSGLNGGNDPTSVQRPCSKHYKGLRCG